MSSFVRDILNGIRAHVTRISVGIIRKVTLFTYTPLKVENSPKVISSRNINYNKWQGLKLNVLPFISGG